MGVAGENYNKRDANLPLRVARRNRFSLISFGKLSISDWALAQ